MRKWISLFVVIATLAAYQNCSKKEFNPINQQEKTKTLETHGGLSSSGGRETASSNSYSDTATKDNTTAQPVIYDRNQTQTLLSPQAPCELYKIENCEFKKDGVNNYSAYSAISTMTYGSDTIKAISQKDVTLLLLGHEQVIGYNSFGGKYRLLGLDEPNTDIGLIKTEKWCRELDMGNALLEATSATVLVKFNNNIICSRTQGVLQELLESSNVDLSDCYLSNVPDGSAVVVEIIDQSGVTLVNSDAYSSGRALKIPLLVKNNSAAEGLDSRCEKYMQSPLVVDMRSDEKLSRAFELTAPVSGVLFDILGLNSIPVAHTPKRISWFKDPRVMPLVLDLNGKVHGINELFGNNTKGPDGTFATDGFHALAKYDGLDLTTNTVLEKDGMINKNDQVFEKLKLWYDKNLDGVADSSELFSLSQMDIEVIDLNFDKNYFSKDQHGNEIKYKSVVRMNSDKKLRPIFDIWFLIDETIQ